MGIRINKMVGYGLADVAVADGKITDPRVNACSPLLTYDYEATTDAFLAWLDGRGDDDSRVEASTLRSLTVDRADARRIDPLSAVVSNLEYGLPNVLCVRPMWMPDWHRSDDTIDWIEETYLGPDRQEPINPRVDVLPHGIYPYSGSYMDARTGQRLDHSVMNWIRAVSSGRADTELLDMLAMTIRPRGGGEALFTGRADAQQHVAPSIPETIALLAEWGRLFTDPSVVLQLRPMRYVWWA